MEADATISALGHQDCSALGQRPITHPLDWCENPVE
jgi:hypothetical protein